MKADTFSLPTTANRKRLGKTSNITYLLGMLRNMGSDSDDSWAEGRVQQNVVVTHPDLFFAYCSFQLNSRCRRNTCALCRRLSWPLYRTPSARREERYTKTPMCIPKRRKHAWYAASHVTCGTVSHWMTCTRSRMRNSAHLAVRSSKKEFGMKRR